MLWHDLKQRSDGFPITDANTCCVPSYPTSAIAIPSGNVPSRSGDEAWEMSHRVAATAKSKIHRTAQNTTASEISRAAVIGVVALVYYVPSGVASRCRDLLE